MYRSTSIVRVPKKSKLRLASHVAKMEETKNECRIFVGKPLWKHSLDITRRNCYGVGRLRVGVDGCASVSCLWC